MSEVALREVDMQSSLEEGEAQTAGGLLRQAREAAGMTLNNLAVALKVSPDKLQALEANDFAAFKDHVFMRALAMSICRSLRMDSAAVLELLPHTQPKSLAGHGGNINEAFKDRSFRVGGAVVGREPGSRKVLAVVLLLLAGAAGVYFFPRDAAEPAPPVVTEPVNPPAAAALAPAAAVDESNAIEPTPAQAVQSPAQAQPPAAAEPAPAALAPQAPAPAVPEGHAALVFQASGASWVQVKDRNGRVVLQKNFEAGESGTVDGLRPLSIVIGQVGVTQLSVDGTALDLSQMARDRVARFEVK